MNMSYCRFRNTLNDFKDCLLALKYEEVDDLSPDELNAAKKMRELCEEYVEYFDSMVDE